MNNSLLNVFRSKKHKPRRKPRKRSEVFPASNSESWSKRGHVTKYDPIMEVSLRLGDDEDMEDEHLLVGLNYKLISKLEK